MEGKHKAKQGTRKGKGKRKQEYTLFKFPFLVFHFYFLVLHFYFLALYAKAKKMPPFSPSQRLSITCRILCRAGFCLFFLASALQAQEALKAPTVLIQSEGDLGQETGTGILVGREGNSLFILTAAHVIANPAAIEVQFFQGPTIPAQVVQANAGLDIAAIRCALPAGWAVPASFALAKDAEKVLQAVIVAGHPLGNAWDLNYNSNVKSTEHELDERLFTLAPIGIAPGNSGGPVLTQQYELLGLVQQVDPVKAVCVNAETLIKACRAWEVPTNLMTGIVMEEPRAVAGTEDIFYQQYLQEANSAFAAQKWAQAKRAFELADAKVPSDEFKAKIRQCEIEMAKDEGYARFLAQGKSAITLETALSYYQQAQQQRNTEEVRQLIQQLKEKITGPGISAPLPFDLPTHYTDPFAGTMVLVEGGTFTMGCDTCEYEDIWPAHPVFLDPFYMGAYEVTVAQFCQFLNERAGETQEKLSFEGIAAERKGRKYIYAAKPGEEKKPVTDLNYCQIQAYCWWLGGKTGHVYRLPTEAEWEYAAKGGQKSKGALYAGSDDPATVAWFKTLRYEDLHAVGLKKPNELGLYDMSGNVWELCQDWYDPHYYESCKAQGTVSNPPGPLSGERRTRRGSAYWTFPLTYRGAENHLFGPVGFRLLRVPYAVYAGREMPADFFEQQMVRVEGGTFPMGSKYGYANNGPVHEVGLDDFYIGKTEITQEQWAMVMGQAHPGLGDCVNEYYGSLPVVKSWDEIDTFFLRLNAFTGMNYRLPTEAEWEYAARGGNKGVRNNYRHAGSNDAKAVAWIGSDMHLVGQKQANELGLYDMSGNASEWCQDWYGENYYSASPARNPLGPPVGSKKVIRGDRYGSKHSETEGKDDLRDPDLPRILLRGAEKKSHEAGFRIARSERGSLPAPIFQDPFENQMVRIKGGAMEVEYMDGYDGKATYPVELADFYIGQYEVTQAQWESVMGFNPDKEKPCLQCPVLSFETQDLGTFLETLNTATGKTYRLPFESEWTLAAKGGNMAETSRWSGTDNENELYRYANYCDVNCNQLYEATGALKKNDGHKEVAPVGSYLPNALKLYDMTGNASELCYLPGANPLKDFSSLIIKGGCCFNYVDDMIKTRRLSERYLSTTGFRLVLETGADDK